MPIAFARRLGLHALTMFMKQQSLVASTWRVVGHKAIRRGGVARVLR
jgi:hypothetical protein